MINTGRSSLLDIYQSDVDTNSDIIDDFFQYSENGKDVVKESPADPIIQTNVSINVDNITFSPKVPSTEINGFHTENESEDEDDSRFEIIKRTTIRKIITRTTSINGVEKENEVKEFLIKDSQMNEPMHDSKKKEDGMFPKSRRGSHTSVLKKSANESKGKTRRDSEVNDQFKSDLEKIRNEFDGKEHSGLSWMSPVGTLDEDVDVAEPISIKISHPVHAEVIEEDKNEIITAGVADGSEPLEDGTVNQMSPSMAEERPIEGEIKWVDPMKSGHLKYDPKHDRNRGARSTVEHRKCLVSIPTRPNTESTTHFMKDRNNRRSFADNKSKVSLRNSTKNGIKEYIIRGNIKENSYQMRHYSPNDTRHQPSRLSPSRRDFKNQRSEPSHSFKPFQTQSYGSMNNINDARKQRSSSTQHLVPPLWQSSRKQNSHASLKALNSLGGIDDTNDSSFIRDKKIHSRVSSILDKVDDVERHLIESSQSVAHRCPSYARHCCSPCCHICSCCVNNCQEMTFMMNPTLRSCSSTIERNYYRSTEIPSIKRNGDSVKNVFISKERGTMSYEKKNSSVLQKRIHTLERRLHTLKKDLEDFKTSEEISSTQSEVNVTSQCKSMEQQLQVLYDSIHQIRAVS